MFPAQLVPRVEAGGGEGGELVLPEPLQGEVQDRDTILCRTDLSLLEVPRRVAQLDDLDGEAGEAAAGLGEVPAKCRTPGLNLCADKTRVTL